MSEDLKQQLEQLRLISTRLVNSLRADESSGDRNAASNLPLAELMVDKLDQLSEGILEHVGAIEPNSENQEV